jgi:hypothetical protein
MRANGLIKTAILLPLATAAGIAVVEYTPELYALGWHALHRGTAHFKSEERTAYEIKVPTSFSAYRPDECSVSVLKQTGPIRSRLGKGASSTMSFSACAIHTTVKEFEANASKIRDELGTLTLHKQTIAVAGQELHCYEHLGGHEAAQDGSMKTVDCVPASAESELSASFVGASDHLEAFYSLLKTVRRPDID